MKDPYEILGVDPKADAKEIKKAYRKLARDLHPDLHPNDPAAEDRFKDVAAAYDVLSDPEKRAAFDRGGMAGADAGPGGGRTYYRWYADGGPGAKYHTDSTFGEMGDDLFSDLFRAAEFGRGESHPRFRGADVRYILDVDFLDALKGTKTGVVMPGGKELKITIPPGSEDGTVLRLRGQGMAGPEGGPAGDALVQLRVGPHPYFRRRGHDIHMDLPVSVKEALLGAKIRVSTVHGPVTVTVPKGSNTGTVLRLKGKGVPAGKEAGKAGDQYMTLKVVLPDPPDPDLSARIEEWARTHEDRVPSKGERP